MGRRNFHIQFK